MDRPGRPLFMKTYGKQMRKVDAWIVPDNHKVPFDSTSSSTSDISVYKPARTTSTSAEKRGKKTSVACRRGVRLAKAKAMMRLRNNSSDVENRFLPSPAPAIQQQNRPLRGKKTRVACGGSVLPAKSKVTIDLTDENSDEQNSLSPFLVPPIHKQQTKPARRVAGRKTKQTVNTSESEGDSFGLRKERVSQKRRKGTLGRGKREKREGREREALPDAHLWRFVTRHRGAAACEPQIPRNTRNALMPLQSLNSSDDFAQSDGMAQFSRRATQGQPWEMTSTESPVARPRNSSVTNDHLRELSSLNDSVDPGLKPCPRKPLFCSTPSLRPSLRPRHKTDCPSSSMPASVSVSDIVGLSITQEEMEVDPPGDPPCASPFAPVSVTSHGVKHLSNLGEPGRTNWEEPLHRNVTNTRRSCNTGEKSHCKAMDFQHGAIEPHSLELFSVVAENQTEPRVPSEETEASVQFVSASGGLECLEENLKKRCVSQDCGVVLERVDEPTNLTQPDGATTYSSCIDHMRSAGSEPTADRLSLIKLVLSTTSGPSSDRSGPSVETDDHLRSVRSIEGVDRSPLNDTKSMVDSQLDSNELSEQFQSGNRFKSNNHTSNSLKSADRLQLIDSDQSPDPTRWTDVAAGSDPLTAMLKDRCLSQQLTVSLEKMSRPQTDMDDMLNIDQPRSVTKFSLNTPNKSQSIRSEIESVDQGVKRKRAPGSSKGPPKDQGKPLQVQDVPDNTSRGRNASLAPQGKKRCSVSKDRTGTSRKACVSGLSLSRWSKREGASGGVHASNYSSRRTQRAPQSGRPGDCSINELLAARNMAPAKGAGMDSWLQLPGAILSTPVRTGRLSSLLMDLTPNTHTWSRLKAALSIHKKTKAFFSPHHGNLTALTQEGAGLADVSQSLFGTPFRTPLPRCLTSQLQINSPLSVCEDELSDAEKVYSECGQAKALAWEACLPPRRMKLCKKIGEGTFGEVFTTANSAGDTVALKIIPLEGSEKVNGEKQKSFGEILHEIIISKELSSLKDKQKNQTHGFIGLNDLHCVQGCYPPTMLKAWDAFDRLRGSENDRPDFFEEDQLFLILEFEFGGSDLENSDGQLSSLVVAKSILHQVTAALAVAEQELCFEHRDLHWGNVLVKPTTEKEGVFLLDGTAHCLNTRGVHVRLIDYSLSRLEIDGLTVSCDISEDEELFMGQGDYQFDIYRIMRQENSNEWSSYQPHSNVLWLHYLCSKLLGMRYRGQGRGARQTRQDLNDFLNSVLQYGSAMQVLLNCPLFQ